MIQDNFTLYKPSKDKSKVIRELKQAGKGKDIILAADDDGRRSLRGIKSISIKLSTKQSIVLRNI